MSRTPSVTLVWTWNHDRLVLAGPGEDVEVVDGKTALQLDVEHPHPGGGVDRLNEVQPDLIWPIGHREVVAEGT